MGIIMIGGCRILSINSINNNQKHSGCKYNISTIEYDAQATEE